MSVRELDDSRRDRDVARYGIILLSGLCFSFVAFCLNVVFFEKGFLDFDKVIDSSFAEDGFHNQMIYVLDFVRGGFDSSQYGDDILLVYVHLFRLLIAGVFYWADQFFGVAGQTFIIIFLIWFSIEALRKKLTRHWVLYILYFSILFFSWRVVLGAVSVVLFVAWMSSSGEKSGTFLLAVLLSSLSAALVLFLFFAVIYLLFRNVVRMSGLSRFVFLMLLLMVLVQLLVKLEGFWFQEVGYRSEYDNFLLSIMARSSFLTKIASGDFLRVTLYFIIGVGVLFVFCFLLLKRSKTPLDVIFFISLFGFFVEGMGGVVIGILLLVKISGLIEVTFPVALVQGAGQKLTS
ncbi:hypothetical protein [Stutzerimonas nitrititolerans]|uniref:hypothetical protein n=1 Tax=Stutzerimonas nitrititolerans TaxID=2482751 RepID=UPI0028A7FCE0|nr:hypothetical protein [Stutzerimonas nitrititolerans]